MKRLPRRNILGGYLLNSQAAFRRWDDDGDSAFIIVVDNTFIHFFLYLKTAKDTSAASSTLPLNEFPTNILAAVVDFVAGTYVAVPVG